MNNTQIILQGAQNIISTGWCTGAPARNAQGISVAVSSTSAVDFCLFGALLRSLYNNPSFKYVEYLEARHSVDTALHAFGIYTDLEGYNDDIHTTREDVLTVLELASMLAA